MKELFSTSSSLFFIIIMLLLGMPDHSIAQDNHIDNKLITAARSKANGMGHNPITLYTDENGHVVFTAGNMLTIRNGQSGIAEGDMVVNVGHRDANVAGTVLKKGEYGIVKNGKFEKASDKIGDVRNSSYLWLIALVGAGFVLFIVITKLKKRKVISDNSRIQPQAIVSPPEKVEKKPQIKTDQQEETTSKIKCAKCNNNFVWNEAYNQQDTSGSSSHNPPGHGEFRPRAFCPHCGFMVAEWDIDQKEDRNRWKWYGQNENSNSGKELPPSPITLWGKSIPLEVRVSVSAEQIDLSKMQEGASNDKFFNAAASGDVEAVKQQILTGADINTKSYRGETAVMLAAMEGHTEVVITLIEAGVDINDQNVYGKHTPLILAALSGHFDTVKELIDSGADISLKNQFGKTAEEAAKDSGHSDIAGFLKAGPVRRTPTEKKERSTTNTSGDTTAPRKTINLSGIAPGKAVDVTISVEGYINGSDLYGGKYQAKLPINLVSDQLLNHIAQDLGVFSRFHMGYMLLRNGKTILTCREKKTLSDADVKNGDILTFIDWG